MTRALLCGLALLAASGQPGKAAACLSPEAGTAMRAAQPGPFAAALRTRPSPVKVGAPFVVELQLCALDGTPVDRLTIDATMPAHRHGMSYRPELVAVGGDRHEGRGFLFHMPGWWEITLSVYAAGQPSRLTLRLDVE